MTHRPPPGLQLERTLLAWSRAALSAAGIACLAYKTSLSSHSIPAMTCAAAAVTTALAFTAVQHRRHDRHRHTGSTPRAATPAALRCMAALVAVTTVCASWTVVTYGLTAH